MEEQDNGIMMILQRPAAEMRILGRATRALNLFTIMPCAMALPSPLVGQICAGLSAAALLRSPLLLCEKHLTTCYLLTAYQPQADEPQTLPNQGIYLSKSFVLLVPGFRGNT